MNLEKDKTYRTSAPVDVCFYDADDCVLTDAVNLPADTELTYVGPDADNGEVFTLTYGTTKLCLHDNDLAAIEAA